MCNPIIQALMMLWETWQELVCEYFFFHEIYNKTKKQLRIIDTHAHTYVETKKKKKKEKKQDIKWKSNWNGLVHNDRISLCTDIYLKNTKENQDACFFYDLKTRTTRTIFDRQIGHSASNFPHLTQVT
jgi:hypothetical protein